MTTPNPGTGDTPALPRGPDERLFRISCEFAEACEAYDRTVCTGGINKYGENLPANTDQRRLIERHALRTRQAIIERYNLTFSEFKAARRAAENWLRSQVLAIRADRATRPAGGKSARHDPESEGI